MEHVKISLETYETLKKQADSVKIGYVYKHEGWVGGYPVPRISTESEIVKELLDSIRFLAIENAKKQDQIGKLAKKLNEQDPKKWNIKSIFKFLGID